MQYLAWVKDIVRGNFGHSFFRSESVADMILRRGPLTAEIALLSVVLSWLVGIPVAIVSALRPNTVADSVARFLSILFLAVPGFWIGMLIVLALLFWFGYRAPLTGAVAVRRSRRPTSQLVIGPAIVLGLGQAAYIARMGRSSLLEVIREDYVRTARAKGLNGRLVIALHALPNALLPVITLSGVLLGLVLAGSVPVERAFATPGLGFAMYTAVSERDIFVMQNLVFLYAAVFVLLNIVVDVTIALLDPEDSPTDDRHRSASAQLPAAASRAAHRAARRSRMFFRRAPLSAFWGVVAALIVVHGGRRARVAPYAPLKSDFRSMQKPPTRSTGSAPTRSAAIR